MKNDELYHYGVKGMKWGQRRAARQISKLTGKDRSTISADEADRFRGNVAAVKSIKGKANREAYVNTNAKMLGGKKYADAILKQANKENASSFRRKAAVGIGAGTVAAIALAPVAKVIGAVNETMWDFITR